MDDKVSDGLWSTKISGTPNDYVVSFEPANCSSNNHHKSDDRPSLIANMEIDDDGNIGKN
jgi:hypothetical protein